MSGGLSLLDAERFLRSLVEVVSFLNLTFEIMTATGRVDVEHAPTHSEAAALPCRSHVGDYFDVVTPTLFTEGPRRVRWIRFCW